KQWESAPRTQGIRVTGQFDRAAWDDAAAARTQWAYDVLDRPTAMTAPGNLVTALAYARDVDPQTGAVGLRTRTTDPTGHAVDRVADPLGRLVRIDELTGTSPTFALYARTRYAYDGRDLLTAVTDAKGNVTTVGYDLLGRKTSLDDRDLGLWTYKYDA